MCPNVFSILYNKLLLYCILILSVNVFVCHDKGNVFTLYFFYNKFTSIVCWKQQQITSYFFHCLALNNYN